MAKTNKSGKAKSQASQSKNKKKNSSDDTMKFLLVLVIAGIAIALIFFSQSDADKEAGNNVTGTPLPGVTTGVSVTPEPTVATGNTQNTEGTLTPVPDNAQTAATATPVPTATSTPTPTPTPVVSVEEAAGIVSAAIGEKYDVLLVNAHLRVGNGSYYQFGVISGQTFLYPFLVIDTATGILHSYDSVDGTVFDFTVFPLNQEVTPTATPTPKPSKNLTVKEAYKVLCTYSKEALKIAKEVTEYDAEYGDELTLIDGMNCYRINLSEVSGGKVRNRGEFYVSVDGTRCYYIDSDTNEFVLAQK